MIEQRPHIPERRGHVDLHEHCRKLCEDARAALADPRSVAVPPARILKELRNQLRTRFDEQESSGFFDEAVCNAPCLASWVESCREQQRGLLRRLRRLMKKATSTELRPREQRQLIDEFDAFTEQLFEYRTSVAALQQEFFYPDET